MNTVIESKFDHSTDNNGITQLASTSHRLNEKKTSSNDDCVNIKISSVNETFSHDINDFSRIKITPDELVALSTEEFKMKWLKQDLYVNHLESQIKELRKRQEGMIAMKVHDDKLKSQLNDFKRRENVLVMKLAAKEHDQMNHFKQLDELKKSVIPSDDHLKRCFVDPAVNFMFEKMRKEVESAKSRVEEMQNELTAWKFTPESNTGKRLMAKCRQLYQENEELGKMISSGRVGQLESNLALQTNFTEEIKKSQSELDEFLVELDEDFEGMQSTIIHLQTQLKELRSQLGSVQYPIGSHPPPVSPSIDPSQCEVVTATTATNVRNELETSISITVTDHDEEQDVRKDTMKRQASTDLDDVFNGDCSSNGQLKRIKVESTEATDSSSKDKIDGSGDRSIVNPFSPTIEHKNIPNDDQKTAVTITNGD